jgi:hypothetical protein
VKDQTTPDTGDSVRHEPTGEEWTVAFVGNGRLCACGWPESIVPLSDCTLIHKATPEFRDSVLRTMAEDSGMRGTYARQRLARESADTERHGSDKAVPAVLSPDNAAMVASLVAERDSLKATLTELVAAKEAARSAFYSSYLPGEVDAYRQTLDAANERESKAWGAARKALERKP